MKKRLKSLLQRKSKYILVGTVLLFILLLAAFHYFVRNDTGDTVLFRQFISERGFWDFSIWRYETFSSRVILEGILYIILSLPYAVFAVLNTIVIVSIVLICKKLFSFSNLTTAVLYFICLTEPIVDFVVVGIQPAAINYIWTLFFALLAFMPVRKVLNGEEIKKYHYVIYGLFLVIGCNMEQLAAIVLCFYVIFLVYFLVTKKKHIAIFYSQLALSFISTLFLLLGKGNQARMQEEIRNYWPDFEQLGVVEKLWNGISSTTNHLLSIPNMPLLLFTLLLLTVIWLSEKKVNLYSICGTLPFLWCAGICGVKIINMLFKKDYFPLFNGVGNPYTDAAVNPVSVWIPLTLQIVVCIIISVALWRCFEKMTTKILVELLLAAGFASRVIMGFSPTLFASHTRTFFFLYVGLFIVGAMLAGRLVLNPTHPKIPLENLLYSFKERIALVICLVMSRKSRAPSTISVLEIL